MDSLSKKLPQLNTTWARVLAKYLFTDQVYTSFLNILNFVFFLSTNALAYFNKNFISLTAITPTKIEISVVFKVCSFYSCLICIISEAHPEPSQT